MKTIAIVYDIKIKNNGKLKADILIYLTELK